MNSGVYVIQARGRAAVKIGYAKDIAKRLRQLQTGSPAKLKLIAVIPGDRDVERGLHDRFADHRLHGEWFHKSAPGLLDLIAPYRVRAARTPSLPVGRRRVGTTAMLSRGDLAALGYLPSAVDAIFRGLPVVSVRGLQLVRVDDFYAYREAHTRPPRSC